MVITDTEPHSTSEKIPDTVIQSQSTDLLFSGTPRCTAVSCTSQSFTVLASLASPETDVAMDEEGRAPVVLVAVVDKSGSMAGSKMKSLKETLNFIVKELSKHDKFAIVEYDTLVRTALPLTSMDKEGRDIAATVIDHITPGSATNLSGGLLEGLRLIPADIGNSTVVSTLLLTDGLANYGIRSTKGIVAMIRSKGMKKDNVAPHTINCFGFGKDHDATMLKEVSDVAEGMYYFIENEDSIASAFADCLGGLLSVSAQGIELEVEALGEISIKRIHTVKQVTEVVPDKKVRIYVGDVQEGEERDFPIELLLPASSTTLEYPLVKLTLSYFDVKEEEMKEKEVIIEISRKESEENITKEENTVNLDVDRHCNRLLCTQAGEEAVALANKGAISEARKVLRKAIETIQTSSSCRDPLCLSLVQSLEESYESLVDKITYQAKGQYHLNRCNKAWAMQRCSPALISSPAPHTSLSTSFTDTKPVVSFETSKRKAMKKKFLSKRC